MTVELVVPDDQSDVPREDAELLAELELTTNLVAAVTGSAGRLSQAEVAMLGVHVPEPRAS